MPFRRGVKQDGKVNGGMPADFKPAEHGLNKLKVATRGGVVFASFDPDVESLEDFMGPTILGYFDRLFNGRKLTILGYNRQRIPGNWKLMQENIKDPYHPGLLHTWFVTFGLWRADNKSRAEDGRAAPPRGDDLDPRRERQGRAGHAGVELQGEHAAQRPALPRHRARALVGRPDRGDDDAVPERDLPAAGQQRLDAPHPARAATGAFDFVWTHFGFEDDDEEMTQRRLRQANLFGPAGFVSADDGEVIELSQKGFEQKPFHRTLAELGGREVGDTDHMVTETLIRGMYEYWRKVMEA